jgi:hypothetical protein
MNDMNSSNTSNSKRTESLRILKVIGKLKVGETFGSDLIIVKHGEWASSFKRFWSGDSRETTISMIESSVSNIPDKFNSIQHVLSYISVLEDSLQGIKNLEITYKDDENIYKRLNTCREKIRDTLKKSYHEKSALQQQSSSDEFVLEEDKSTNDNNSDIDSDNDNKEDSDNDVEEENNIEEDEQIQSKNISEEDLCLQEIEEVQDEEPYSTQVEEEDNSINTESENPFEKHNKSINDEEEQVVYTPLPKSLRGKELPKPPSSEDILGTSPSTSTSTHNSNRGCRGSLQCANPGECYLHSKNSFSDKKNNKDHSGDYELPETRDSESSETETSAF